MGEKRKKKRPADMNRRAFEVVREAVGEAEPEDDEPVRGRAGGIKGGKARAQTLTAKERSEIARIAARARWEKADSASDD